ncbi:sigma-B regulation protein RsbU (phosphoserine phosphatase) [Frankia sp. EI5c]|uniref:PP2C family protein-serine/threonine phosphatase n=1 Tax=Frankia sp. EI5c TaxID=683316 RepID=UPI0007C34917|nr:SpoIIE family protein phosphatase [Frankia sp. EI5c]OAA28833.1 sigma-B regulation protein RsbU (phosphoserine phosphatase) [Frankia sp. EI5c]
MGESAGLRSGIRVLVAISVVALAAMLALAIFAALRASGAAAERGERLDPAATTTALLLADFVDQESAVRGYLITEQPNFLGPYNEADRTIPQQMNRLQQLLADFPELVEGTAAVEVAYQAWRSDVAEPEVAAMEAGDVKGARDIEKSSGRVRFNELRGSVGDLGMAIAAEQTEASGRLENAAVLLLSSLASAAVVIIGVVFSVLHVLRRWLLRPIDALRRAVNSVAAGRYDTRIPEVGPSEIVELAGNIEAMRAQLVQLVRQNDRSWEALAQEGPAVMALRDALTPSVLRAPGLLLRGRVDPARGELAGDWYDSFQLPDGRIGVVVGDVSGHGAVAGVFALRLKQLLDAALTRGADPGTAIEWVVDSLGETDEMFATAVVAVVDPASGEVRIANAGHPEALLLRRTGEAGAPAVRSGDADPACPQRAAERTAEGAREPSPSCSSSDDAYVTASAASAGVAGTPAGPGASGPEAAAGPAALSAAAVGDATASPAAPTRRRTEVTRLGSTGPMLSNLLATEGAWHTKTLRLEPGDVLFVYTDGLVEARDDANRQFGVDRLVAELLRDADRGPAELLDAAFDAVRRHAPGRPSDDRTAIVVARTAR